MTTTTEDLLTALSDPLSGCDPRDLGISDLASLRKLFDESLFLFAWFIGGATIMDVKLHGEFCAYIQKLGQPGWMRLMTQMPRDSLKSTIGTMIHALWRITLNPDQPIAIFNHTEDNTKRWISGIRSIAEGQPLFQALYRDLLPPGIHKDDSRSTPRSWHWNESALDFEGKRLGDPENSISGWGTGSSIAGHHWPLLIIDDIVGKTQFESEPEMQRTHSWARGIIHIMRPSSQGMAYVNCTPWGYNDAAVTFSQQLDFKLYRRSALEMPDGTSSIRGESIFPSRISKAILLREHATDAFTFFAQRQCIPRSGESNSFNGQWLLPARLELPNEGTPTVYFDGPVRTYTPKGSDAPIAIPQRVKLSEMSVACFLDPAASDTKKAASIRHARSGFVVQAIDQWERRVILETLPIKKDGREVLDTMFTLQQRWGFTTIYIEEVNFSIIYRQWLMDLQRPGQDYGDRYLMGLPAYTGGKNKDARILRLVPGMKSGMYYLMVGTTDDLVEELTEYPHNATCDLLDALAYDYKLRYGVSALETLDPGDPTTSARPTACPITGY